MTEKVRKGLSSSDLKWIAIITMFIDHFGAVVFIIYTSIYAGNADITSADQIYTVIRNIGRTAFPIFCFLLVEGLYHTRDIKKYLVRLFCFCLISEIPFDLALSDQWFNFASQNVFWTLFLGLAAIAIMHFLDCKSSDGDYREIPSISWISAKFLIAAAFMLAAELLDTDYGGIGVALIVVLYMFRERRLLQCIIGYLCFFWERWCFPAFIVIWFYDGRKGMRLKYFFYLFYPCHLILLYVLRIYLLKG